MRRSRRHREAIIIKAIIGTAIVTTMLSAATLGMTGLAVAAPLGGVQPLSPIIAPLAPPLNDPSGLCSFHDDKGNCQFAASGPSVDINMVFPSNVPQEQAIVDYLTKVNNDFDPKHGTLDAPVPSQALDVTSTSYNSGTPQTGTQTVVVKVYQNLGGPYPTTWYKGFSYNNAAKAPITFDSLFALGTKPLEVIMPIVQQQMSSEAGQPITITPDVGLDPANYQNFAITNDAVIFFFDKNQMHPAYDATEVSVPRTAIATMLKAGI
jgi:hypothetical protein